MILVVYVGVCNKVSGLCCMVCVIYSWPCEDPYAVVLVVDNIPVALCHIIDRYTSYCSGR